MAAIYSGDVDALRTMLDEDPSLVSDQSSCGHPHLLQCVAVDAGIGRVPKNAAELTELLIERGADQLLDAVVAAASTAAAEVLPVLLDHGAPLDVGSWKPLDETLYWSHTEFAAQLVELGAPVDRLRSAAGLGNLDRMSAFFEDDVLIASAGPIDGPFGDRVDPALAANPGEILNHALVFATLNGQLAAMEWLAERGADVNAKPTGFHWGGGPLHGAVWRNDREMIDWLLSNGADPSIKDDEYGGDALGWAKHNEHTELIELFENL